MIDILIDDRKFVFSRHVLEQNPEFIVTQILRGMASVNDYPFIERVDDHTFRIDISIHDFEKIAIDLRSKDDKQKDVRMSLMIPMDDQTSQFTGLSTDTQNHVDVNDFNLESDFVNIPDLTEQDNRHSVPIISEKSAKHSQSVFDPLNMLDTKPSQNKSDMGIFRRSDAHRADAHRADAHRADAHRADAHRADAHRAGGKGSKHTKTDAYIGFTEMSQDISDVNLPLQNVVPKGHHVYKSRKIELDTSEHKR
jgi:hypothetical protein